MDRIQPEPSRQTELQTQLDRHGITLIPQAVYEWRGYRYSSASDAIAAAQRASR